MSSRHPRVRLHTDRSLRNRIFLHIYGGEERPRVSRRFDKGLDDIRCLSFDNGLTLRPTLSSEKPADMGMSVCTRVEMELKRDVVKDPERVKIRVQHPRT